MNLLHRHHHYHQDYHQDHHHHQHHNHHHYRRHHYSEVGGKEGRNSEGKFGRIRRKSDSEDMVMITMMMIAMMIKFINNIYTDDLIQH